MPPQPLEPDTRGFEPWTCPSDQERAYLLIDVLEQNGYMEDEFAHEMAANATQDLQTESWKGDRQD